ncbi:hypothetical protein [Georgenia deserti]|uniref:Uncharacterized protein n=1 Tax=Georgenia deserti TaxID=2093781 RepID=A0ABW4LCE7_9MICO
MLRRTLTALARRWYVTLLVLAVAAVGTYELNSRSGVYSTRTTVAFTYSYDTLLTPNNSSKLDDVIAFAGAVAADVVPERPPVRYSQSDAPYYGAGLRQGVLVGLLDHGSQWGPSYGTAVIMIQIVGPTQDWVAQRQEAALARIEDSTDERNAAGADERRIVARIDPLSTRIEHIVPSRFTQVAALGAIAAAASLVAGWAATSLDRRSKRSLSSAPAQTVPKES